MRGCMNSEADNYLDFAYVFMDYFIISDLQGCLNVHFEQIFGRQEVPHEEAAHDRSLELGEVRLLGCVQKFLLNKKLFGPKS